MANIVLRMKNEECKKKSTDDEKPSIVCYKPFILVLFFTFNKVVQCPLSELVTFGYFS